MNSNQQVHLNMVETTKPAKMMEATQFTKEEYDKAKTMGFAVVNEFKKNGMEKLAGMEKDPKSDLNTYQGGIKNVRRVRVLKNSSIMGEASWDQKNISLVLDLLSAAKNVPVKPTVVPKPEPLFVLIEVPSNSLEAAVFVAAVLELAKAENQKATGPLTVGALTSLVLPRAKGPHVQEVKKPNRNGNGKRPDKPSRPPAAQTKPQVPPQN